MIHQAARLSSVAHASAPEASRTMEHRRTVETSMRALRLGVLIRCTAASMNFSGLDQNSAE